ncbi:hypothetical protein Unana1_04669 [Umbelopsis nana]
MRLFKLCIGCYGEDDHDFAMYFFDSPITPPVGGHSHEDNFWKLEDLQTVFRSKPLTINHIAPSYRTSYDYIRRDAHGNHYVAASALLDLASYMQIDLLGQLCRLTRQDIRNGRADSICKSLDIRGIGTYMMIEQEFIPSDITPPSPMTPSGNGTQGTNNNKRKRPALESSRSSGKQSLLAKRLAGKHRPLTIYAAPYADQTSAVRTAPAKQYSDHQLLAPPIVQSQQKQIYPPPPPTHHHHHPPQRTSNPQIRPFEDLFDTIEATRSLKETLDDQVRRSAHVLKELNANTVKKVVESEMLAFQQHIDSKLEHLLTECSNRLSKLESAPSSSPSLKDLLSRIEKLESRADQS